jgi:glycosyltransferase involved in cell wall biosynthesis
LYKLISETGLQNRIDLPGYLRGSDKTRVLGNADIFVLPSYGEGCPVSMLEAMAAGMAIVSTPVGGIPDLVHDGKNGILIGEVDPENIYKALKSLMSSPELLASMRTTNREVAWRCYEAGVVSAGVEDHYRDCVRGQ